MDIEIPRTLEAWNSSGKNYLPGHFGITFDTVEQGEVIASLPIVKAVTAWNGFLHAGTVVSLADTCCGYGTVRNLPDGAQGFTTVELKTNFLSTVREGSIRCRATPIHIGRTTQVWDAVVKDEHEAKTLAHFRCTQMILWPKLQADGNS